uniref:Caspase 2, apoptosis-related cysteine peptidase n=1 Tax=Eptatretus burgeri TaxID=7764 RepID=A0A8C4PZY3_EPTBU
MEERHKKVLRLCRIRLIDDLVLPELLQHLIVSGTLNELEQIAHLLTLLPKRGPDAFTYLCVGLQATGQEHLEKHLITTLSTLQVLFILSQTPLSFSSRHALGPCDDLCDGMHPISVQPSTHEFYLQHAPTAYCMRAHPRGLALLLSNVDFLEGLGLDQRAGGEIDRANIEIFALLKYNSYLYLTQEMEVELAKFAQKEEHSEADMAVVVILSHGVDGAVYGVDGALLPVERVFNLFNNGSCPRLQQKPKVFLIQACRGGMRCVHMKSPDQHFTDGRKEEEKEEVGKNPWIWGKLLSVMGPLILLHSPLCFIFTKCNVHVQVNSMIKAREAIAPGTDYHQCKEMSEYGSTLCKNLYLFPGC